MAFTAITSTEVQPGKPLKAELFQKIKDNFDFLASWLGGDAPSDGATYGRKDGSWSEIVLEDYSGTSTLPSGGVIAVGDCVFVREDGKAQKALPEKGTPTSLVSGSLSAIKVARLDATRAVIVYQNSSNSEYGTACVLSISGTTITAGTPVVFESANTSYSSVAALDSSKAIVTYRDNGNSGYGTACVLSISGTTITAGTPVVFESASTVYSSVAMLNSSKAIVCYKDAGNSNYGTACVLSVAGTIITVGAPVVFSSSYSDFMSVVRLTDTLALVAYRDVTTSNYGFACPMTVSGSSITPGFADVFDAGSSSYISAAALSETKVIITYRDSDTKGRATVISVNGNTFILGSTCQFETGITYGISTVALSSSTALVTYIDVDNSSKATYNYVTVDGSTPSAGVSVVYSLTNSAAADTVYLGAGTAVSCYLSTVSLLGTGCVLSSQPVDGVCAAVDGGNVTVVFTGIVKGLSGLTTGADYYLSQDGLKTTIQSKKYIGKAISSSQLLLRLG